MGQIVRIFSILSGCFASAASYALVEGTVSYQASQWLASPALLSGASHLSTLQGELQGSWSRNWFQSGVDAGGIWTINSPELYLFYVRELYVGSTPKRLPYARFQFGRVHRIWNFADEEWKLGLWEPRVRWNPLHPQSQGLVGAFAEWKRGPFELRSAVLLANIPTQSAPTSLKDGKISSNHPFGQSAPESLDLEGASIPIEYKQNIPSIASLLFRPGVALYAGLGQERGFWMNAAYAFKPMSTYALSSVHSLTADPQVAHVTLTPRVLYHHLTSASVGYRNPQVETQLGIEGEWPIDLSPVHGTNTTTQNFLPLGVLGWSLDFQLPELPHLKPRVGLGYVRVFGEGSEEVGALAREGTRLFGTRIDHREAGRVRFNFDFPIRPRWGISTSITWIQDFAFGATFLNPEIRARLADRWHVIIGADLLGSGSDRLDQDEGQLLTRSRLQDHVYGGLTYAF